MKQHITSEDLNQLSDKAKEKLREYWKPQEGDWFTPGHVEFVASDASRADGGWDWKTELEEKEFYLPLLTIGQLIEFLDSKDPGEWSIRNSASGGWVIVSQNLYGPSYEVTNDGKEFTDLCTALWQAVKSQLEANDK